MKKTILILTLLAMPLLIQAKTAAPETAEKQQKMETINELIIQRDQAINAAQELPATAKSEAIIKAQNEFWGKTDPLLMENENKQSLIDKALYMIKNIFK